MNIDGQPWRSVWAEASDDAIGIIDQTRLPHELVTMRLTDAAQIRQAIVNMNVRGAPLIGVVAAFGLALATNKDPSDQAIATSARELISARPTAINLQWAIDRVLGLLKPLAPQVRAATAWQAAREIADEDVRLSRAIGDHGLGLIRQLASSRVGDQPINILTHCNAGWLATVDFGTATAPIYRAHDEGISVHVWVDETRPRNQGAGLTTWELAQHGVPHTLIADNAGGHLMQHGMVDLCLVGSDRTTAQGDVCNKIGTYLKALAAFANQVPFYVALPSSTIDWTLTDGVSQIPIENRDPDEVLQMSGLSPTNKPERVRIAPPGTAALNPAFDVTPAQYVTGLITERGICAADARSLAALFNR